jgi:hypothetical protein
MSATGDKWPVLTGDEIARRMKIGRERRAGSHARWVAYAKRRRAILDELRRERDPIPEILFSSSDDEL